MERRGLRFRRVRGTGRKGNARGRVRSVRCLVCLAEWQGSRIIVPHTAPCPEATVAS